MTLAQPWGIATALGLIHKNRPWLRAGAFAFTAVTQAIWERDRQVQNRKVLMQITQDEELCFDVRKEILDVPYTWMYGSDWVDELGFKLPDKTEKVEPLDGLENSIAEAIAESISDGMNNSIAEEISYHIQTFYSSRAICGKSLLAGASLGILPWVVNNLCLYGSKLSCLAMFGMWSCPMIESYVKMCALVDQPIHNMYSQIMQVNPGLLPPKFQWMKAIVIGVFHGAAVGRFNDYKTLDEWRAHPKCWYSRKGKLPIFQYNVEEE